MNDKTINENIDKVFKKVDNILKQNVGRSRQQLRRQYRIALEDIRKELRNIYDNYGDDIAKKKFTVDKLTSLTNQISESIVKLKIEDAELTKSAIKNIFSETYYLTGYALESSTNLKLGFHVLNNALVEAAVNNPYDKIGWGNRSAKNISRLIQQTRDEITQGIIQGKSYTETAKILSKKLGIGASKAIRIVRTESGRAVSQSRLEAYKTAKNSATVLNVDIKREWIHSGSPREPRADHMQMDGQQTNEDNQFILPDGTITDGPRLSGVAEHDINCGCTERTVINGIENASQYNASQFQRGMSFQEWKSSL